MKTKSQLKANSILFLFIILLTVSCGNRNKPNPQPPPDPPVQPQEPTPEPTPQTFPDLVFVGEAMSPSGPAVAPGTTLQFNFKVRNIGNASVTGGIAVSGPGIGFISGGLQPGQTKPVTVNYTVHSKNATYNNLVFTIDPDNITKESNENNNNSRSFSVRTTF